MLQTLTRPFGALMVAATLALGVAALLPADLQAAQCFCPPGHNQNAHSWAMGFATCAQAKAACAAQAQDQARAHCSSTFGTQVCSWGSLTYAQPNCMPDGQGGYKVDCDQRYACERCLDF